MGYPLARQTPSILSDVLFITDVDVLHYLLQTPVDFRTLHIPSFFIPLLLLLLFVLLELQ